MLGEADGHPAKPPGELEHRCGPCRLRRLCPRGVPASCQEEVSPGRCVPSISASPASPAPGSSSTSPPEPSAEGIVHRGPSTGDCPGSVAWAGPGWAEARPLEAVSPATPSCFGTCLGVYTLAEDSKALIRNHRMLLSKLLPPRGPDRGLSGWPLGRRHVPGTIQTGSTLLTAPCPSPRAVRGGLGTW